MNSPPNGFGLGEAQRQIREQIRKQIRERELIDSAIELARTDDAAWRHLRTLLVKWALEDEDMRRELLGELKALGEACPGNAKAPKWTNGMLVGLVKIWTAKGPESMTVRAALSRVAREFPHLYPDDLDSLWNRYYRVRKDPEVRRIAGLK